MKKKILFTLSFVSLGLLFASSFSRRSIDEFDLKDKEVIVLANDNYSKEEMLKEISSVCNADYRVVGTYKGIANGYRIEINSKYINDIDKLDSVFCATENKAYSFLNYDEDKTFDKEKTYKANEIENDSLIEMNVPLTGKRGEGTLIAVLDSAFSLQHNAFKDLDSSLDKKITKNDVNELIAGTELNATGDINDLYFNDKIPFYFDYGGKVTVKTTNNSVEYNNVPDNDVNTLFSTHGMHVSSIAAANGEFEGVAKNAQLAFMKVFGDIDSSKTQVCIDDYVLNALNDAYLLGADSINMSLGSDLNEFRTESASFKVISKIKENGGSVNVASGNSGKGNWSNSGPYANDTTGITETGILGSYSTADDAMVVAASTLSVDDSLKSVVSVNGKTFTGNDQVVSRYIGTENEVKYKEEMPFSSLIKEGEEVSAYEYVMVPGVGSINDKDSETNEDLGNDYEGIDVKGKIAVIKRGNLSFADKIKNAKSKGAIAVIIYNGEGLGSMGYFDLSTLAQANFLPTFSASVEEGEYLAKQSEKVLVVGKDKFAEFSSDGATADLKIKPEISTPGQNIAGAVNTINGKTYTNDTYQYLDGTSMATPNYSGAYSVILGEQDFANETERSAFAKTVNNRAMSTAHPIYQPNGAPISVRKQGAGLVDVESASNTEQYLIGTNDDSKVELKNDEGLASGKMKFDVKIINESGETGTYNAKLSITVPETTRIESETNPNFNGVEFQTTNQRLVDTKEFKVSLTGAKEQIVNVSYDFDETTYNSILDTFENGCLVEGFVEFDSTSENLEDLSIPYLGFLGDFSKGDAVEPFNFEKEEGKVYQSDLLNSCLRDTGMAKANANFASTIVGVGSETSKTLEMEDILTNDVDLTKKYDEVGAKLVDGKYHIYVGKKGLSETVLVQQFVNRSVVDNTITMTDENGKVVLTDHMFDSLFGEDGNYSLYKSRASLDLISGNSYYIAHRAYTILSFKDKANNLYFEDGEYNLKFEYELDAGFTQTKEYVLVIDSKSTGGASASEAYIDSGVLYLIFEEELQKLKVNSQNIEKDSDLENGVLYKIDLSNIDSSENIFIETVDSTFNKLNGLFSKDRDAIIYSNTLRDTDQFILKPASYSGSEISGQEVKAYQIGLYDNGGKILNLSGEYKVSLLLDSKYENATAQGYFGSGNQYNLAETNKQGKTVTISGVTKKGIVFAFDNIGSGSGLNIGIIAGISIAVVVIIAGVVVGIVISKKKASK